MLEIKNLAKDFDLKYKKELYNHLYISTEELIIKDFFGNCPDPEYIKYGNCDTKNVAKNFQKFYNSKSFQERLKKLQGGCVTHKEWLNFEKKLIKKIPNKKLRNKVIKLYQKLGEKMGKNSSLALIDKNSSKHSKRETLLHEYIHILNNSNNVSPKSFEWNEGLVTYMTCFGLGRKSQLEQRPKETSNKMWNIYLKYGHKWALLLKKTKTPKERKEIILIKLKYLNKRDIH